MVFHINSRLLNSLGLLSAGVLLVQPNLVNAQMAAPKVNSTAPNPAAPAALSPTVPVAPKPAVVPPVMPPVVPAVPKLPTSPLPVVDDKTKPMPDMKPVMPAAKSNTIVDVAAGNASFKTLVAALKAAGLTEALMADGPFTVFAPTDDAFAALPKGLVEKLLKPENKPLLVTILTYHVVPGKLSAADLKSGQITSLQGSPIVVKLATAPVPAPAAKVPGAKLPAANLPKKDDAKMPGMAAPALTPAPAPMTTVMINQAKVKIADVMASNGVIHAIDQVILPAEVVKQLTAPTAAKPAVKPATGSAPVKPAAGTPKAPVVAPKPMMPK
jgi:uncharacterized surface protein with fasciclin (FAS1) repeats